MAAGHVRRSRGILAQTSKLGVFCLAFLFLGTALGQPSAVPKRPAAEPAAPAKIADLVSALASWTKQSGGRLGAAIIDVGSGELVARASEHEPLNPASNQKLLTAAVALSRLGSEYRFTTGFYGELRDGASGDLVLRGHGDPSLKTEDLWELCRALVALGLARLDGDLLIDQSRFDAKFVPPAFEQQPDEWSAFRAPVSAIALDGNTIAIDVFATRAGAPARVSIAPRGFVSSSGSIETRRVGSGQAVSALAEADGTRLKLRISGHLAEGLPRLRVVRRVDDPRLYAGYVALDMLRTLGVKVRGGVREGGGAEARRLVFRRSAPLGALIHELGKSSDNFYAEMLLKALGAEVKGAPGTSASGGEAIAEWLREIEAFDPGTVVKNGSGLFDANRLSAWTLARALVAAYRDPRLSHEFVAELAIGGVDGTLHSRFPRQRQRRAVRAKTGTLRDVVALSGYVLGPGGRAPRAFSLIVVGLPGKQAEARQRIDGIVERMADELWTAR
jgi:serine-type D-Ala-D-Ala carboxypeptidase/endopeptidase (penicillin-binding protein 4)